MTGPRQSPQRILDRWGVPVVIVTQTRTTDRYGNVRTKTIEEPIPRALFEPEQQVPRTDPATPGITSPAKWYLPPGVVVTEDDIIRDPRGRRWVVTSVQEWPHGSVAAVKRWGTT